MTELSVSALHTVKPISIPPLPYRSGYMPVALRADLAGQVELWRGLYPNVQYVPRSEDATLTYFATIEYKKSAFLILPQDPLSGREYIAKLLRKTDTDLWRPQRTVATRLASLKIMEQKLERFAPGRCLPG